MYKLACIFLSFVALAFSASYSWNLVTSANGQFPPYDSLRPVVYNGKAYSFGGFTENQDPTLANVWSNDVWTFDGSHWTILPTTGAKPTPRGYEVAFIRGSALYIVFGGSYDSSFGSVVQTTEMSKLDLTSFTWSLVTYENAAPGGFFAPAGWYDQTRDSLYIFGGINFLTGAISSTTYRFDFSSGLWHTLSATGPSGRYDVSLTYALGFATIYGGETLSATYQYVIPTDVQWIFDDWSETWTQINAASPPNPPRNNGNGMAFDWELQMVMYGGDIGGGIKCPNWFYQNSVQETWLYNPLAFSWTKATTTSSPPPLKRAGTFILNGVTYLYGGFYFTGCTVNRNQNTYFFNINPF